MNYERDDKMVAIFRDLCLWRHSLCSNFGGIDPGKLIVSSHFLYQQKRFTCDYNVNGPINHA